MIGLLLTILFPGLGHFYYGKNLRGIILVGISFIPYIYPVALIFALVDVYKLSKSGIKPELSRREAFTVIVLCFVLPVLFFFLAVTFGPRIYYNTFSYIEDIKNPKLSNNRMIDIKKGLDNYFTSYRYYPENLEELVGDNPIRKKWLLDLWGNSYIYVISSDKKSYELISIGKDGMRGTEDDITKIHRGSE